MNLEGLILIISFIVSLIALGMSVYTLMKKRSNFGTYNISFFSDLTKACIYAKNNRTDSGKIPYVFNCHNIKNHGLITSCDKEYVVLGDVSGYVLSSDPNWRKSIVPCHLNK